MSSCQQAAHENSGPTVSHHLLPIVVPSLSFIGYQSHILPSLNFQENFVFSCVALETSIKSPCCSPSPLSLKMTFDLRATKIWKRIERTETPHHHTRWCYLTYLDIPLLFVSLHHLILLITTGMRLLFFFCCISWSDMTLKPEVQNLLLRKEVECSICTNFPQIANAWTYHLERKYMRLSVRLTIRISQGYHYNSSSRS